MKSHRQKPGFTQIHFRNGIYQGQIDMNNNTRQGLGIFYWDSGDFYFGEWKNDQISGEGIIIFVQGGHALGQFKHNKLNGKAILQFPNKDIYQGTWISGQLHGHVTKYLRSQKLLLECTYKGGIFHKKLHVSRMTKAPKKHIPQLKDLVLKHKPTNLAFDLFSDQGYYLGVTNQKIANGLGLMKYADGKFDTGNYMWNIPPSQYSYLIFNNIISHINGFLNGMGRLNFLNGDVYDGWLKQGQFSGEGVYYKKEQNRYIYGDFEEGQCKEKRGEGDGNGVDTVQILKYHNHAMDKSFTDVFFPLELLEVPLLRQEKKDETTFCQSEIQSEQSVYGEQSVQRQNSGLNNEDSNRNINKSELRSNDFVFYDLLQSVSNKYQNQNVQAEFEEQEIEKVITCSLTQTQIQDKKKQNKKSPQVQQTEQAVQQPTKNQAFQSLVDKFEQLDYQMKQKSQENQYKADGEEPYVNSQKYSVENKENFEISSQIDISQKYKGNLEKIDEAEEDDILPKNVYKNRRSLEFESILTIVNKYINK